LDSIGRYRASFVTKSSYEKKCISCSVDNLSSDLLLKNKKATSASVKGFTILVLIAGLILVYQLTTIFGKSAEFGSNLSMSGSMLVTKNGDKVHISKIIESVVPKAGFETNVKWGNVVTKMIKTGVLDPLKLENVLKERYKQEMRPEWRAILAGKNENLKIDSDNAVFMMYILWTLSKSNTNQILFDSPFVKYFKNYNIGVGKAGYGNVALLQLTPKQQQVAKEVAENANRPCCNNSTAAPDCSHGYSALGLVELMASQDFTKQEIFDTFVKFNSFWFPETYVKNALYFKLVKGKNWNEVNKETVAGKDYSSLGGAYKVKNYLKTNFGI